MQTQQQPCDQLDHEPRQPSMVERLAYRYDRLSIFPQDQNHTQSFVFHPVYKNLHGNPNGEPRFRLYVDEPTH
jgi:hypothetical protein